MSAPGERQDLFDDYLNGTLDEAGVEGLESRLRADAEARHEFVRYCRLHTDLHLEARASEAGQRALRAINHLGEPPAPRPRRRWWLAAAAVLLAALGGVWWWSGGREDAGR